MKIINEHVDVDRDWIVNKMIASLSNLDHWDSMARKRDEHGRILDVGVSSEDVHDMACSWAEELDMEGMEADAIIVTKPFQDRLRLWANSRYDEVLHKIKDLTKGDFIPAHRFMRVTEEWFNQNRKRGSASLGIYWTFDLEGTDSLGSVWGHEQPGEDILIHAMIPTSAVDWHYTILANMDWYSGDYEHELRVKAGAPIRVEWIQTVEDGTRIGMSGVKYTA